MLLLLFFCSDFHGWLGDVAAAVADAKQSSMHRFKHQVFMRGVVVDGSSLSSSSSSSSPPSSTAVGIGSNAGNSIGPVMTARNKKLERVQYKTRLSEPMLQNNGGNSNSNGNNNGNGNGLRAAGEEEKENSGAATAHGASTTDMLDDERKTIADIAKVDGT